MEKTKTEQAQARKEEQKAVYDKLRGSYAAIKETPAFQDFKEFVDSQAQSLAFSAQNRVGLEDGKVVALSSEQVLHLLSKSAAYKEMSDYLERLLTD